MPYSGVMKKDIKTTWNLGLLYKSEKDPQIEKDLQAIEKASIAFEKKYKGKDFTSTPEKLAKALKDMQEVQIISNGGKPSYYFALRADLNSTDSLASALMTKYDQRITKANNKLTFFTLEIGKIPKTKQKAFLAHSSLRPYAYRLKKTFKSAQYRLSEGEEQLLDLLSQPGYEMWVDGQGRVLADQTVKYKGEVTPLPKALEQISNLLLPERRVLKAEIDRVVKQASPFAEAEINAIYNYKKIVDERRGFATPLTASVLSKENEEAEVLALAQLITKHFPIAHRFYKLHAKLLKEKRLRMEDRGVKIGKIDKKFTFEDSLQIVGRALGSVDPKYKDILDRYVSEGHFDVYPRKGKRGGAYCSGPGALPVLILLNHADVMRSVETLGHEMGHAIHTELARTQPRHYQGYSLSTAETASTFFEQVTMEELEKGLSEEEKIVTLHNRIMGDIATVFRQIACFNFEIELHERIRKDGQVAAKDIAALMQKHLQSYVGPAIEVTDEDGYFYVYWSHIRRFFYVYTYAYGQLVSRTLFEKWKLDPSFAASIEKFLKAGSSMSPKDIFKSIGIDTSDPEFFKAGLKGIENDIKQLEKLTAKRKS